MKWEKRKQETRNFTVPYAIAKKHERTSMKK